jgi:hypothetical protein
MEVGLSREITRRLVAFRNRGDGVTTHRVVRKIVIRFAVDGKRERRAVPSEISRFD